MSTHAVKIDNPINSLSAVERMAAVNEAIRVRDNALRVHPGKEHAYTWMVGDHGIMLAVVVANEPNPFPLQLAADSFTDAQAFADEMNSEMGLPEYRAAEIVRSAIQARPAVQS